MVLRFLFGTPAGDLGSPPADSPSPTSPSPSPTSPSQGGSGNGSRADVARRAKEVEYLLASLEKEGVEVDDKIASIIDDEVARIKAEAARENMNEPKRSDILLDAIVTFGVGFILGADWFVYALRVAVVKRLFFWV
ncbi:hypothetical protein PVAP13_4KG109000 [Panicum virgatum]|uniref:Uncharacterized protein n=1 Tax=Panicum virgatum TaxID=38727 RepID=A0A8T0TU81_PANVG|nr:hypothetical protein PVAP13_4KG109000 [Panicum virgatum]